MLITDMQRIVQELRRRNLTSPVIQNHLKEHLQLHVLDYLYNSPAGKSFIFTGGSCLRICYGLNRLSEDVDFDLTQDIDIDRMAGSIFAHFEKALQFKSLEFSIKGKHDKVYLKFPILRSLGLSDASGSDKLYVKIETSPAPSKDFGTELTPVDRDRFNILIRHYDLPSLMAGKICAVMTRVFFKGKANEITFKGRDIYDLVWYLERGVHPNMNSVKETLNIDTEEELFEKIWQRVSKYKPEHVLKDLENLFDNRTYIEGWTANFRDILKRRLKDASPSGNFS